MDQNETKNRELIKMKDKTDQPGTHIKDIDDIERKWL